MTPTHLDVPSPWVTRFAPLLPPGGTLLDLACGAGRHARYLAARGFLVDAVDRDASALALLDGVPNLRTRHADLESDPWPFPGRHFDGIVVTNYLYRPLFPLLAEALADKGLLLYETFMRGHELLGGKPSNPAFLLESNELFSAFAGLTIVAFEEGRVASPRPALVQRLCATKGGSFRALD